jgi:hypothetical protein
MDSQRTPGREALKQIFDGFSVLVPDLRITVEDIITGGDWAAVRSTVTGTSAGPTSASTRRDAPSGSRPSTSGA